MATVRTKTPGYTGHIGKDLFVDGVCEVPDDRLDYYIRHGYLIDEPEGEHPDEEKPSAGEFESLPSLELIDPELTTKDSANQWRDRAQAYRLNIDGLNKNQIMAVVVDHEEKLREIAKEA